MYALAASAAGVGMLALSQPSEAKIVYTKIHQVIGPGQNYSLDLNHDGRTDFTFLNQTISTLTTGFGTISVQVAYQTAPKGNGPVGYVSRCRSHWHLDSAMKEGVRIGGARHFLSRTGLLLAFSGRLHGLWYNATNRYLGLKFKIRGKTHYGWARLSVTGKLIGTIKMTLTGYAYETIPNKAIIAGKTKGPDASTVAPASLGHLAAGASAIPAWRSGR
jgi:hypothetical protein